MRGISIDGVSIERADAHLRCRSSILIVHRRICASSLRRSRRFTIENA